MRNWIGGCGVYRNMVRAPLFLLCSYAALAQPSPQQDPLDAAIQAVWQARNNGRIEEAIALREQVRAQLQRAPVDAPRFSGWVQQVAQLYQNAGMNGQARAVLQDALARTAPLGDSHPSRVPLLSTLGDSWRQDGNLLKALGYWEQAAAAPAAAPVAPAAQSQTGAVFVSGKFAYAGRYVSGSFAGNRVFAYTRLADLYRQLGRPDAIAAVAVKVRMLGSNDESALAQFYEQHGQFEEASAIYKKQFEQAADPQVKVNALQALANLYVRQGDYNGAIGAVQQAIAAAQSLGTPGMRNQAFWLRNNLAGFMRQAGLVDQADQVYQQLLQETSGGPQESQALGMYAQYLSETSRGAQAQGLLKDYLAGHANLDTQQKTSLLFNLSNVARSAGDSKSADEYQKAAQALQPQPPQPPPGQFRISEDVEKARAALTQHRLDDAYGLALHIIDTAAHAIDGQQVEWLVTQVAQGLAAAKQPAKAEQLFQRLLAAAQDRSVDGAQLLVAAAQNYARFLMGQPDRLAEVPAAIERYRRALIDANGPESGSLAEPLRMRLELERTHSQWEKADVSVRELLELQESLSGNTSEPYLGDLQTSARAYEAAGDSGRALPLLRKAIAVADLVAQPDDWRRSLTRMDAARALARLGQFDEAESLAEQAFALRPGRAPGPPLARELEQIRRMKQAAAAASSDK